MNIAVLGEHSIDISRLAGCPSVLDVGCRGFSFGDALRLHRPFAFIHELDIDDLNTARPYTRAGLANFNGCVGCSGDADPQARHIIPSGMIPCYTIDTYSHMSGIQQWDVVKLDCEGAEYKILEAFDRPWAKQLSVEFHQHTPQRRNWEDIDAILAHLSKWYDVVQHVREPRHGCGDNYWDTLVIAR